MSQANEPDTFPERLARVLFERYPSWQQYKAPPDFRWQSGSDIAVEVPSRFAPRCPLRVETTGGGIIISWAGWHEHCDDWAGQYTEEQFVAEALEVVEGLMNEERVVVIDWQDGPGGTGGLCESGDLDNSLKNGWWARIAQERQIAVISWKGTYDQGPFDPDKC